MELCPQWPTHAPGHDEDRQDERNNDLVMPDRNRDTTRCRAPNSQGKYSIDALTWSHIGANKNLDRTVIHPVAKTARNVCVPPSRFSGVVSAVADLLALGVDVQPSGRLRLYEAPNTQADLTVAESWWSRVCTKETNVPTADPRGWGRKHIRQRQRTGSCRQGRFFCGTG